MENFINKRTKICKSCPICDLDNWMCSSRLYINPTTNDVSTTLKNGYIKGCGCNLTIKIKNPNKKCPAGKWLQE